MGVADFKSFQNGQPHLVGQPFTLLALGVPMNAVLTCNCGAPADAAKVEIKMSVAAECPSCKRIYNALFNPQSGKVEFQMAMPKPEGEPS
jgi:hypothetical protein